MPFLSSISENVVWQDRNPETKERQSALGYLILRFNRKSQSAMEFLTTYSWAILVLLVVLAVLFQLGVFSSNTFTPRVQPGACQVSRPNGPGTTQFISTVGLCNGQLPEYVMTTRGAGQYVLVQGSDSALNLLNIHSNTITITAWVKVFGAPYHAVVDKEDQYGMKLDYSNLPHACTHGLNPGFCLEWDTSGSWIGESFPIPDAAFGKWMFLAVTMQGDSTQKNKYWYANGNCLGNSIISSSITFAPSNFVIGAISPGYPGYGADEWFNGMIANVQVYNSTLSPNTILHLYNLGIGSAPVNLQSLVGWWPLNGNTKDYSGNNNTNVPSNVAYVNTWMDGYSLT